MIVFLNHHIFNPLSSKIKKISDKRFSMMKFMRYISKNLNVIPRISGIQNVSNDAYGVTDVHWIIGIIKIFFCCGKTVFYNLKLTLFSRRRKTTQSGTCRSLLTYWGFEMQELIYVYLNFKLHFT